MTAQIQIQGVSDNGFSMIQIQHAEGEARLLIHGFPVGLSVRKNTKGRLCLVIDGSDFGLSQIEVAIKDADFRHSHDVDLYDSGVRGKYRGRLIFEIRNGKFITTLVDLDDDFRDHSRISFGISKFSLDLSEGNWKKALHVFYDTVQYFRCHSGYHGWEDLRVP